LIFENYKVFRFLRTDFEKDDIEQFFAMKKRKLSLLFSKSDPAEMSTNNSHFYLAVLHTLGFTQRNLRDISPESAEEYFRMFDTSALLQDGFSMERAQSIVDKRTDTIVEVVERILGEFNIQFAHINDEIYPSLLRVLPDAPTILYFR